MKTLPRGWFVHEGRDPEREAQRLKRRFQAVSRRHARAVRWRRLVRRACLPVLLGAGAFLLTWSLMSWSPWPPLATLQHLAAFPNCQAARMAGLAPAYAGQPGYYRRHDADGDGRSCEPWLSTSRN